MGAFDVCGECGASTGGSRKEALRHQRQKHPLVCETQLCFICGDLFFDSSSYESHVVDHQLAAIARQIYHHEMNERAERGEDVVAAPPPPPSPPPAAPSTSRRRGRASLTRTSTTEDEPDTVSEPGPSQPKRGRGRPRKRPLVSDASPLDAVREEEEAGESEPTQTTGTHEPEPARGEGEERSASRHLQSIRDELDRLAGEDREREERRAAEERGRVLREADTQRTERQQHIQREKEERARHASHARLEQRQHLAQWEQVQRNLARHQRSRSMQAQQQENREGKEGEWTWNNVPAAKRPRLDVAGEENEEAMPQQKDHAFHSTILDLSKFRPVPKPSVSPSPQMMGEGEGGGGEGEEMQYIPSEPPHIAPINFATVRKTGEEAVSPKVLAPFSFAARSEERVEQARGGGGDSLLYSPVRCPSVLSTSSGGCSSVDGASLASPGGRIQRCAVCGKEERNVRYLLRHLNCAHCALFEYCVLTAMNGEGKQIERTFVHIETTCPLCAEVFPNRSSALFHFIDSHRTSHFDHRPYAARIEQTVKGKVNDRPFQYVIVMKRQTVARGGGEATPNKEQGAVGCTK